MRNRLPKVVLDFIELQGPSCDEAESLFAEGKSEHPKEADTTNVHLPRVDFAVAVDVEIWSCAPA